MNNMFTIGIAKKNRTFALIAFCGAIILLLLQEWMDLGIDSVAIAFILSFPFIVLPKKTYTYYAFFCIPLCFGLHGLFSVILLVSLWWRLGIKNRYQFIFPIILILLEIFNCFANEITNIDFVRILIYFAFLGIFFYTIFYESVDYDNLLKFLCIGFAFGLLLLFGRILLLSSLEEMLNASSRASFSSDDYTVSIGNHFVLNANNIAFFSIALFSTLLCTWERVNMNWKLFSLLSVLAFSIGIFTYSRTWILCVIMLIALYILLSKLKEKFYFSFIFFFIFLYLIYTDNHIIDSIFMASQSRFDEVNIETAGDRTVLFKAYNNWFMSHFECWLTGTGVIYYKDVCKQANSIHNGIQQVVICTGFIGITVLLFAFSKIKRMFCKSKDIIQWLPIVVIFIFDQSIQSLNPHLLLFPFILGVYALKIKVTNKCLKNLN